MDTLSVQAIISARDAGYKAAMADAISQSQQLEKASENCAAGISKIAIGNVVAKGVTAAFSAITNAIGGAVKRIDTLNNFKPVMESLGYSATEAEASINKLSEGIDGLPTTLDGIVSSAQMLTASLDDLGKGTEAAIALNDMFLAGGQGAEAAARGLTQYNQMLAKGKVDQQSWNTLVEVAPGQLKQLASELVGASASQKDLYDALQSGKISMEEFNNTVIRLDQEGGQGFQSFADQARAATGGIATAWQNVQTAVVKGVASVIDAINQTMQATTGAGIADVMNSLKDGIKQVFDAIAQVAGAITSVVAPALQFLGDNFDKVAVAVGAVVGGMAALKIIDKVKSQIDSTKKAMEQAVTKLDAYKDALGKYGDKAKAVEAAEKSRAKATELQKTADKAAAQALEAHHTATKLQEKADKKLEAAEKAGMKNTKLNAAAQKANEKAKIAHSTATNKLEVSEKAQAAATKQADAATKSEAAAQTLSNTQISIKDVLLGVLSGKYSIATAAQLALNAAMAANPIGLIITAISALISVISMLTAAFGGPTEAAKKAQEEFDNFIDECQDTADAVDKTIKEFEAQTEAVAESDAKTDALVSELEKLSKKTNKTADEKAKMSTIVGQLNGRVEELNVTYDAENDKLSESIDFIKTKVSEYKKLNAVKQYQDALNDAIDEEIRAQAQLNQLHDKQGSVGYKVVQDLIDKYGDLARVMIKAGTVSTVSPQMLENYDSINDTITELEKKIPELAGIQEEYGAEYEAALDEQKAAEQAAAEEAIIQKQKVAQADARIQEGMRDTAIQCAAVSIAYQQKALDTALEKGTVTLDQLSEKNQATVGKLQEVWRGYYDSITDTFNALSNTYEKSAQDQNATLRNNIDVANQFATNLQTLRSQLESPEFDISEPGRQALERMIDAYNEGGPQYAGEVQALVDGGIEALQERGNLLAEAAESSYTDMVAGMSKGAQENMDDVKQLVTDLGDTLNTETKNTDWSELPQSIIEGITSGLGDDQAAIDAAISMSEDLIKAGRETLMINSPSKVFEEQGKGIDEGMENGITRSVSQPVNAAQQMAQAVINATRVALSDMFSVGVYAMQGFVSGLQAMAGTVMATAASIANSAAATIKSALKVSSPSKVLAQIGEWTGEGFVIGLKGTENAVRQTMDQIADITAGISVPNLSSRTFRTEVAFAGTGYTSEIGSLREEMRELRKAVMEQPINIATDLRVDGRSFARATATYTKNEIEKQERLANNLGGIK